MTINTFFTRNRVIALVSFSAIVAISLMKSAMELEDAEQAYFSQWLRLGYDDQPPLYTWFQYGVNLVFGINTVSFSLLRALIFALILMQLYRFSASYLKSESKANLTVFSLALIPVFIDFTFRRLSHTSLLCLFVIITYILIQQLIKNKTFLNYLLFGMVVGLGLLSKYNYIFVLGALGLTVFIDKELRAVVFNTKIFLSILIAILITAPHFYWLFGNQNYLHELRSSVNLKTSIGDGHALPVVSPIIAMLKNIVMIIAPITVLILILKGFRKLEIQKSSKDWLFNMLIVQLVVILLFFVFMGVDKTEERWFLPLLLPFIPLVFKVINFQNSEKVEFVSFLIFLFVIGAQTVRTPIEKVFKIPSDVHFGFQPISEVLNSKFSTDSWVLPNVTYAGNIRLLNTSREIYAADDFSLPEAKLQENIIVEVVIGREEFLRTKVQDSIFSFGRRKQPIYFLEE